MTKLIKKSVLLVAAATCMASIGARAQVASENAPAVASVDAPGAVAAPRCELHIWPAERFAAMTTGLLGGGLLDYAVHAKGDAERKSHIASALDSHGQLVALVSLDLPNLLHQQNAEIIQHETPLTRHTVNDIKTRRADSQSPCYSELIVADVFYQKAAIYGRSLRTLFIYREFGSGTTATRIYKAWGGNGLKLFPPKPGEDIEAADAELVGVFKGNFKEFARNEAAAQTTSR